MEGPSRCSFCNEPRVEGLRFIVRRHACICEPCVLEAMRLLTPPVIPSKEPHVAMPG